MTFSNGLHPKF